MRRCVRWSILLAPPCQGQAWLMETDQSRPIRAWECGHLTNQRAARNVQTHRPSVIRLKSGQNQTQSIRSAFRKTHRPNETRSLYILNEFSEQISHKRCTQSHKSWEYFSTFLHLVLVLKDNAENDSSGWFRESPLCEGPSVTIALLLITLNQRSQSRNAVVESVVGPGQCRELLLAPESRHGRCRAGPSRARQLTPTPAWLPFIHSWPWSAHCTLWSL